MVKIGVIGYRGRLGSQLVSMGCDPIEYDITSEEPLDGDWNVIINCAGVTNVDACEDDWTYSLALQVNGYGIKYLANAFPGRILHISTDYVFAGMRGPYSEKMKREDYDLPTKKMGYGISKFLGELSSESLDNVNIIRTTGLYGGVSGKPDFASYLVSRFLYDEFTSIEVAKDVSGNQTYVPHLAEALIKCAEMDVPKYLHIASKDIVTRYEFALMLASVFGFDKQRLIPVKVSELNWLAERPKNGGLKVDLAKKYGLHLYSILDGLQEYKNVSDS